MIYCPSQCWHFQWRKHYSSPPHIQPISLQGDPWWIVGMKWNEWPKTSFDSRHVLCVQCGLVVTMISSWNIKTQFKKWWIAVLLFSLSPYPFIIYYRCSCVSFINRKPCTIMGWTDLIAIIIGSQTNLVISLSKTKKIISRPRQNQYQNLVQIVSWTGRTLTTGETCIAILHINSYRYLSAWCSM